MTKITSPWALTNYEQTFKSYVKKSDIKSYFDKGDLVTEVHTNNFISSSLNTQETNHQFLRMKEGSLCLASGSNDPFHETCPPMVPNLQHNIRVYSLDKHSIMHQGVLGEGGANYGSSGDVLTSGGAGAAPTWETPTTGDITGVSLTGDTGGALSVASGSAGFTLTGGTGIDTSGSGTTVTFALDLSELTDTAIANGDYIVFTDTTDSNATVKGDLADVATLFAGTGLTASSSVIGVDASQTQITAVGTIATGEWNGDPITHAYIADDIVSGQDEITSGFAAADELMYSDGGVIKRVGLDVLATKLFSVATAGTVAQASDHMLFLDAGATGDVIVESIDDFLSAIAGSGISVSSSQLTASGGISESDAIALIMALG